MKRTILLISPPGSGKTTCACTLPGKTLIIDIDCKAHRMLNIKHLVDSGAVTLLPIKEKLTEESLRHRALNPDQGLRKQPEGFLKAVDILNDIIDDKEEYRQYDTIVLDSLTRLTEHLKRLMTYNKTQGKFGKPKESDKKESSNGDMNWPSWGTYLAILEEVFTNIVQIDKNFICCAHEIEESETDPITNVTVVNGYWPMVDGQFRRKIGGYFDEVYHLTKSYSKINGEQFQLRTKGNKYCSRSSFFDLPEFVDANLYLLEKNFSSPKPKTEVKNKK